MRTLSYLMPLLTLGLSASLAFAAPKLKVDLEGARDEVGFVFALNEGSLEGSALKASFVKGRLVVEVSGVKAARAWQKAWEKHPKVKRAIVYPSKSSRNKAYLKVRFASKLPQSARKGIQVTKRGGEVLVRLPWKGAPAWGEAPEPVAEPAPAQPNVMADLAPAEEPVSVKERAAALPQSDELTLGAGAATLERSATKAPQSFAAPDAHSPEPHELRRIHAELALAQTQVARSVSAVPRVLALPFGLLEASGANDETLKGFARLSCALLDEQMIANPELLWLNSAEVRSDAEQLRYQDTMLSVPKARALAAHEGADFVIRSGLRFEPGRAGIVRLNTQLISTMSGEVTEEFNYFLSEAKMRQAFEAAWRERTRTGAITRAALFPGWGHLHQGKKAAGWGYAGVGAALAAGAVASMVASYLARQDYLESDPSTAHRRADANAHTDRANLLWAGYGATWLASLLSTVATAKDHSHIDLSSLDLEEIEGRP